MRHLGRRDVIANGPERFDITWSSAATTCRGRVQPAGQAGGNGQFRAPKAGLRMISRSVAPEFDVIDRGMAALLD